MGCKRSRKKHACGGLQAAAARIGKESAPRVGKGEKTCGTASLSIRGRVHHNLLYKRLATGVPMLACAENGKSQVWSDTGAARTSEVDGWGDARKEWGHACRGGDAYKYKYTHMWRRRLYKGHTSWGQVRDEGVSKGGASSLAAGKHLGTGIRRKLNHV